MLNKGFRKVHGLRRTTCLHPKKPGRGVPLLIAAFKGTKDIIFTWRSVCRRQPYLEPNSLSGLNMQEPSSKCGYYCCLLLHANGKKNNKLVVAGSQATTCLLPPCPTKNSQSTSSLTIDPKTPQPKVAQPLVDKWGELGKRAERARHA